MKKNFISDENLLKIIQERLSKLEPRFLKIEDESHLHIGHEAWKRGGKHYQIFIASKMFYGMKDIDSHRLVYKHLSEFIPFPIHALVLKTQA